MGWYHAKQILDGRVPSAQLTDIVEPWLFQDGNDAGAQLRRWCAQHAPGVALHSSVEEMAEKGGGGAAGASARRRRRLALVASRTADMPALFAQVLAADCSHVYLEKPGATTVAELEAMSASASRAGVGVFMGYNKNVTRYVTEARDFEARTAGASTTFFHNNAYAPSELAECFERNPEGMLKNMAVHEIAVLCTFYGVSADTIASVAVDMDGTSVEEHGGHTDFAKVAFTITTTAGTKVTVRADRCGGSSSGAHVQVGGEVVKTVITPTPELELKVKAIEAAEPGLMPYFSLQDEDYVTLKERVARHVLDGSEAEGVASIGVALETLKVCEVLKPIIEQQYQQAQACGDLLPNGAKRLAVA